MSVSPLIHAQLEQTAIDREQQNRIEAQIKLKQDAQNKRQTTFTDAASMASPDSSVSPELDEHKGACFSITYIDWQAQAASLPATALVQVKPLIARLTRQTKIFINQQTNNCLFASQLIDLQNQLTKWLLAQGYLTSRIDIPNQNIRTGTLQLILQPGYVHQMEVLGQPIGNMSGVFPRLEGRLFNQREIDQSLENIKRLSSQAQVTIELKPAQAANGTTVAYILGETTLLKRLSSGVGTDNSGSKGAGEYQSNGDFTIDSPLGLFDQLSFNAGHNTDADNPRYRNHNYGVTWDVPVGYVNLQLSASQSNNSSKQKWIRGYLIRKGQSTERSLGISWVNYRDGDSKSTFKFKLGQKKTVNTLNDTLIDVQYRDYTYAQLDWDYQISRGDRQYNIGMQYKKGIPQLSQDLSATYGNHSNSRFSVYQFTAAASIPLSQRWHYNGNLKAQIARKPMPASEAFSLGDRYTIRGFQDNPNLTAENGLYIRNDLTYLLGHGARQLYFGLDWGVLDGTSADNLGRRTIAGGAVGLRGSYKRLSYDINFGYPLIQPKGWTQQGLAMAGNIRFQF